jgi:hypothetical protein
MKADVEGAAIEIMNAYFAINAAVVDGKLEFTFGGNDYYLAKDAKKVDLTVFSYDLIKKLEADGAKIDVTADVLQIDNDLTFNYKAYDVDGKEVIVAIDYATAYAYAKNLVAQFHVMMDKLDDDLYYGVDRALPFMYNYSNAWQGGTKQTTDQRAEAIFANTSHKFNGEQLNKISNADVKAALLTAVKNFLDSEGGQYKDYHKTSLPAFENNNAEISGYQEAIVAVNPAAYFTVTFKKVDGVETAEILSTSFDKAAYKKALDAKISEFLAKFSTQIFNVAKTESYEAADALLQSTITVIVKAAFEHDLWNLAGAFDAYTYEINVNANDLDAATITILNAKKKAVTAVKVGKFADTDVYAKFAVENTANGVYALTYELCDKEGLALANEADVLDEILTKYEDLDECLADRIDFEADAHVYDVRKAANEIAANLDKISNIPVINQTYNYGFLTAAQIQKIFDLEASADYNYAYKNLVAQVYQKNSNGAVIWGKYINEEVKGTLTPDLVSGTEDYIVMMSLTLNYKAKVDAATDLKSAQAILDAFKVEIKTYFEGLAQ